VRKRCIKKGFVRINSTRPLFEETDTPMPLMPEDGPARPATARPPLQRSVIQRSVLTTPLLDPRERARIGMATGEEEAIPVVFELNLLHAGGADEAYRAFSQMWHERIPGPVPSRFEEYVRAHLSMTRIRSLVQEDQGRSGRNRAIHRVWPDFPVDLLSAAQASSEAF
jgi:hypothetical protein